uniref:Uncharacterized protein n=1 Tax=Apteryx owenii TaxID=8824 RepID=A0A8B9PNH5_APTOW
MVPGPWCASSSTPCSSWLPSVAEKPFSCLPGCMPFTSAVASLPGELGPVHRKEPPAVLHDAGAAEPVHRKEPPAVLHDAGATEPVHHKEPPAVLHNAGTVEPVHPREPPTMLHDAGAAEPVHRQEPPAVLHDAAGKHGAPVETVARTVRALAVGAPPRRAPLTPGGEKGDGAAALGREAGRGKATGPPAGRSCRSHGAETPPGCTA